MTTKSLLIFSMSTTTDSPHRTTLLSKLAFRESTSRYVYDDDTNDIEDCGVDTDVDNFDVVNIDYDYDGDNGGNVEDGIDADAQFVVVEPAYITIGVNPYMNWNVIVGNDYEIVVDIFDVNNNRLSSSDNIVVEVSIPGEHFKVCQC